MDRRHFIKTSAITLASASFAHAGIFNFSEESPVVIIGAGLAGLTTAYQLKKNKIPFVIYEASARLGGRVSTRMDFNSEHAYCELGGEFIDSSHSEILSLAKELGIIIEEIKNNDPSLQINGNQYNFEQYLEASKPLVAKIEEDLLNPPKELSKLSIKEYLHKVKGMEEWARQAIQTSYTVDYGVHSGDQSANCLVQLGKKGSGYLFAKTDRSKRILGGSKKIIDRLLLEVGRDKVLLEHKFQSISQKNGKFALYFSNQQKTVELLASQVVCTIPLPCLRQVEGIEKIYSSNHKLKDAIQNLSYGTSSKFVMGFPTKALQEMKKNVFTDRASQSFSQLNANTITNHFGGIAGKNCSQETLKIALSDLENFYGNDFKNQFDKNTAFVNWYNSPYSLGSNLCPTVGEWHLSSSLTNAQDAKFILAGEHMSAKNFATMNGAVESAMVATTAAIQARKKL